MFSLGQANSTFFKYYLPVLEGFLLNVFRRFSCGLDARAPSERKTGIRFDLNLSSREDIIFFGAPFL